MPSLSGSAEAIFGHRLGDDALDAAQRRSVANRLAGTEEGIAQIMRPVCSAMQ